MAGIPNVDIVIPGHNTETLVWNDLVNYSGFYNSVVVAAKAGMAPSLYSDFAADPDRLRITVQHIFDGE